MRILILVTCMFFVRNSYACSCLPETEQEKFCNRGDFAMLVKINTKALVSGEIKRHNVKVVTTYRTNNATVNAGVKKVQTGLNGGLCGVTLIKGKWYVISGTYNDGEARTETCDLKKEFDSNPENTYTPPSCPA